jgi:uncharacterized protein (DUF4415 family)
MTRITVEDFSKLKPGKTDWARLRRMKDEDIDFSDAPELTDEELARMVWHGPRAAEKKVTISLRVDPDLLAWFKRQGRGYQSRMHLVLRAFMEKRAARPAKKPPRRAA